MSILNLSDTITLLYILLTLVYLLSGIRRIDNPGIHLWMRLLMIIFIYGLICAQTKSSSKLLKYLRDLYPLFFLAFFFYETDSLNNLFFSDFDPWLVRMDLKIFGFLPSEVFAEHFSQPWISELMHLGYFSFYLIILFFVLGYYFSLPELFVSRFYIFLQSFYLFYLIFIFFPSAGPQYFFTGSGRALQPEGFIGHLVHLILQNGDRPAGAFPSSHIGITWLIVFFFFKDKIRWALIWLLPALALTLATVYIRAHYAVDVIGGLIMAVILYFLGFYSIKFINASLTTAKWISPQNHY